MKVLILPLLAACSVVTAQRGDSKDAIPYEMAVPARVFTLPPTLVEVSALTDVDSSTVACVQDEQATMYLLSLADGRVIRELSFGGAGDMEGLTRVGEEYFALRSDGLIHRLVMRSGELVLLDTFRLDVPNQNIEGLGYDDRMKRILVSPKDFIKGSPEGRDERVLYSFDPTDPQHKVSVALELSVDGLIAEARAAGMRVPVRYTAKGREVSAVKLRFSSVAVHPVDDHYYLLSAVDRLLVVVDRSGRLVAMVELDGSLLPKPEGITFLEGNDLLLSSEGKGSAPVMVRFTYRP